MSAYDINNYLHRLFDITLDEPIPEKLFQSLENETNESSYSRDDETLSYSFLQHKLLIVILGMVLGGIIGIALHKSHDLKLLSKAAYIVETIISRFI